MSRPAERPFFLDNVERISVLDGEGHYLELPSLTTAQRNALTLSNGMVVYNSTTGQVEAYQNGAWVVLSNPQDLGTTSTPQFARLGLGVAANGTNILTATSASTTDLSKTVNISHTGAITGTGYAAYFSKTGASTTNVGLYATASGATNNYAAIFESGNVGIGTTGPQQKLTISSGSNLVVEMATPGTPTLTCNTTGGTLADGTYYYKIVASDGVGTTMAGSSASCNISGGGGAGSVSISWSAVTGAASYRVYGRDTGYGQYWTSSSTSYTDTGTAGTSGTPPTVTTAYVNKVTAPGNSWFLGGNVGIGTAAPTSLLSLGSSVSAKKLNVYEDITNKRYGGFGIPGDGTLRNYIWSDATYGFTWGTVSTTDGSTFSEKVRITTAGNVGIGTTSPNAAALLSVVSTSKGFLPPVMTTAERDAIASPPAGLIIWNSTTGQLEDYNGSVWAAV